MGSTSYLEYVNKIAQIKLKRYDAYAKVLALSVVFQNQTGTKGKSSIDAALESYA